MNRILIVDDTKVIRDTLSDMLSVMGFEVAVASSGHEGLDLFLKKSFDLVLTDLQMPDMDGWTLAFNIKEESPNTPVVLITGEEKRRVMEELEGSCVDSVMFKPFALEDIQETVQKLLYTTPTDDDLGVIQVQAFLQKDGSSMTICGKGNTPWQTILVSLFTEAAKTCT